MTSRYTDVAEKLADISFSSDEESSIYTSDTSDSEEEERKKKLRAEEEDQRKTSVEEKKEKKKRRRKRIFKMALAGAAIAGAVVVTGGLAVPAALVAKGAVVGFSHNPASTAMWGPNGFDLGYLTGTQPVLSSVSM
ncbi:unnamed protein product [Leuciscus chuanchicus]